VGISRNYPLETRTSKEPMGEIPGYEIIHSRPLKYPKSKQGLTGPERVRVTLSYGEWFCGALLLHIGRRAMQILTIATSAKAREIQFYEAQFLMVPGIPIQPR
jgi:hypothetical protein